MKKIISVLISLLFIASTFGIVSLLGEGPDCCDPDNFDISTTSLKVAETFTIFHYSWGCTPTNLNEEEGLIEKIRVDVYKNGELIGSYDPKIEMPPTSPECWFEVTYKAVKPGTVVFSVPGCGTRTVIITPKALPMDMFMKLFGFGQKD